MAARARRVPPDLPDVPADLEDEGIMRIGRSQECAFASFTAGASLQIFRLADPTTAAWHHFDTPVHLAAQSREHLATTTVDTCADEVHAVPSRECSACVVSPGVRTVMVMGPVLSPDPGCAVVVNSVQSQRVGDVMFGCRR